MEYKCKDLFLAKGVTIRKRYYTAALFIPLLIVAIGLVFLGGCNQKQTVVAPAVEQETKQHPDAGLASIKISGYARPEALMSVYELHEKTVDPDILVIDARGRTHRIYQKTYPSGHIPGALPVLYSSYCNATYPGRIATPPTVQDLLGKSGVTNTTCIVLYGGDGLEGRLYWAIKMYGHDHVKILDGGLENWRKSGYDISATNSSRSPVTFEFDLANSKAELLLATLKEIEEAVGQSNCVIVDARTDTEYTRGHIPGSVNVPYELLLNKDLTFKIADQLKELFEGKKITPEKKVFVYSNAGIRSSMIWFALSELCGYPNVKNYDGSLNEWLKYKRPVVATDQKAQPNAGGSRTNPAPDKVAPDKAANEQKAQPGP